MPINQRKDEYNAYMRRYYRRQNEKRIQARGGKCEECGEARMVFLSITKKKKPRAMEKVLCWNCKYANKTGRQKKEPIKNK